MENGQIVRFVEAPMPDGGWELLAEVYTENGLVLGHLFAPTNAADGVCRFRPAPPELQRLAGSAPADPGDAKTDPGSGALTTSEVPTTGTKPPADPNDPRGLKRGR